MAAMLTVKFILFLAIEVLVLGLLAAMVVAIVKDALKH